MWFRKDENTVHTEMIHTVRGMDIEIAVRFGSSRIQPGSQFYNGEQGWFCAYVVMRDADFDRISDRLSFCDGYPELDVPGGVSYFSRIPPFDDGSNAGFTVIGWDYNHGEPYEKDVTFDSVMDDAKRATEYLSGLFDARSILRMIVSIPLRYDRMTALVAVSDDRGSLSRTRDSNRARARFFIEMLAPIMRVHIQNTIRDHEEDLLSSKRRKDSVCGLTVNGMMRTLGTLMIIVNRAMSVSLPHPRTSGGSSPCSGSKSS